MNHAVYFIDNGIETIAGLALQGCMRSPGCQPFRCGPTMQHRLLHTFDLTEQTGGIDILGLVTTPGAVVVIRNFAFDEGFDGIL